MASHALNLTAARLRYIGATSQARFVPFQSSSQFCVLGWERWS